MMSFIMGEADGVKEDMWSNIASPSVTLINLTMDDRRADGTEWAIL